MEEVKNIKNWVRNKILEKNIKIVNATVISDSEEEENQKNNDNLTDQTQIMVLGDLYLCHIIYNQILKEN